jgi:hypothetical protein
MAVFGVALTAGAWIVAAMDAGSCAGRSTGFAGAEGLDEIASLAPLQAASPSSRIADRAQWRGDVVALDPVSMEPIA